MKFLLYSGLALLGLLGFYNFPEVRFLAMNSQPHSNETAELSDFEKAVEIIKKYETLHQPRHWPLVGYGHKVLPGESFSRSKAMNQAEAEELLRNDLLKNCAVFRSYGADSLLLGVLAYNIGSGTVKKSSIVKRLQEGNRDIEEIYKSYAKYKGKTHTQLRNRRIEEFESLFIRELPSEHSYPADRAVEGDETTIIEESI